MRYINLHFTYLLTYNRQTDGRQQFTFAKNWKCYEIKYTVLLLLFTINNNYCQTAGGLLCQRDTATYAYLTSMKTVRTQMPLSDLTASLKLVNRVAFQWTKCSYIKHSTRVQDSRTSHKPPRRGTMRNGNEWKQTPPRLTQNFDT